ncbi:MAG TPA: ABC transporter permease [Acidobacteriota bacterium]|nr:ABC transporter permease [Acidobacteriota bacterium]
MPDWRRLIRERIESIRLDPHDEAEIIEELTQEAEERYQHALGDGASRAQAESRVRAEIEDGTLEDAIRTALAPRQVRPPADAALIPAAGKGERFMSDYFRDVRYAIRMLAKSPLFTAVAVLSLALGIGANTTIFTLVNRVLLSPLPVREPSRLVSFFTTDARNTGQYSNFMPTSYLNYRDYRDQNQVFSGLAAYQRLALSLCTGGEPVQILGELVTGNYFDVLGVQPAVGRFFSYTPQEDEQLGAHPFVVLSHSLWEARFGADRNLVGHTIILNRRNFTVLGIASKGFRGINAVGGPDVWVPFSMHDELLTGFERENFAERRALLWSIVGRLKTGVAVGQANAAAATIARQLEQAFPRENDSRSAVLLPVNEATFFSPDFRNSIAGGGAVLMAVVGLVLLIACANVANLLLARATGRQREIAVRISLGASRSRLIRQLMTESVLLALAAGAAGLLLAQFSRDLLWSLRPAFLAAGALDLSLDSGVLIFTFGISLATGLLFGLLPALQLSRPDLAVALKDRAGQPGQSNRLFGVRGLLVIAQVALSFIALIGAGLFMRSLQNARHIDPGFQTANLAMLSLDTGAEGYSDARAEEFHRQITARVGGLPVTQSVAIAAVPPLSGGISRTVFREGVDTSDRRNGKLTPLNQVSPGYFETVGVPILRGRSFTDTDRAGAPMVAVINETMARRLWPNEEPLGKRFRCFGENWIIEVVGIARDGKYLTLGEEPLSFMYFPLLQHPSPFVTVHVKTRGEPESAIGPVRSLIQALDPQMPLINVLTAGQLFERALWAPRMAAALLSVFGFLGLLLAALGVHGVISYNVAQRTREIGIRIALGARPVDVLAMVIRQTLLTISVGAAVGVAGGFVASRRMGSLLFDVDAGDPLIFVATVCLIVAVGIVASLLPARRASRVDPLISLRYE